MALNFTQLSAFKAVADAGSFGRGAETLLVSQPAVSKQIKQLESALGLPVFERNPQGVLLTEAGRVLHDYARRIFNLADEASQAVDDLQHLCRGKLAIGASPTLGTYFLPEVLVAFRSRFPSISLSVEIENAHVLHRRIADGMLHLGFSEVAPADDGIAREIFMHDHFVAIAPPKSALARKRGLTTAALCDQPFVVRETGSDTKSLVERALANRGLSVKPVLSVGSTEAVKRAVSAGMGVAIVSSIAAGPDIENGRVTKLPVKDLSITRPLYQLHPRDRRESKAATAFLCLVRRAAAGRPPRTANRPRSR